jgi:hypothetical protein
MRRIIFIAPIVIFTTYTAEAKKPKTNIPFSNTISWTFCQNKPAFDCLIVKDRKVGKRIFTETWESLFPDTATRTLVMKINRLNIKLRKGMFVAVPKDKKKTFADFSPFPQKTELHKEAFIIFDPERLALGLYDEKGLLVRWMPAIGGRDRCLDTWKKCHTVTGKFKIEFIGDENSRSHLYPIGCPKKEPCAPMPHFVGFHQCYPRERMCFYGFHSSNRMEGKHASHGCVRLFLDDAKWLNQNFAKLGMRVITLPYPPSRK